MQATRKAKNAVNGVAFRPLQDADLPVLTAWLAEPHVRRFYQKLAGCRHQLPGSTQ
jgi:hypothetical protein